MTDTKANPAIYIALLAIIFLIAAIFPLGGYYCVLFALLAVALMYAVMYHLNTVAVMNVARKLARQRAPTSIRDIDAVWEEQEFVGRLTDADDLVQVVVGEERYDETTRDMAAEKLLNMWKNGRQGGITLDHLAYVGDHADEPHRSEANEIIKDNT